MPEARTSARFRRYVPLAVILAGLVLAYAHGVQDTLSFRTLAVKGDLLKGYVSGHLLLSALGFVLLYALATAFVFPAPAILTVASGFLFEWWIGGALTVIGATAGACVLFLAARSAFRDTLQQMAGGAVARFAEGFRSDAFTYLLVLRLTPVLPFAAVNIGPAFLDVRLATFAAATFLGIIPGSMVYAFLGSGLDSTLAAVARADDLAVGDLVTAEMSLALAGLALLSLLGLVLKKRVLVPRRAPAGKTP